MRRWIDAFGQNEQAKRSHQGTQISDGNYGANIPKYRHFTGQQQQCRNERRHKKQRHFETPARPGRSTKGYRKENDGNG